MKSNHYDKAVSLLLRSPQEDLGSGGGDGHFLGEILSPA
jgi:hypothetical protein